MDVTVHRGLFKDAAGIVRQCVFQGHESQVFNDSGKTVSERLLDILKDLSSPFDDSVTYPVGASCFVPGEDKLFKFTSKKEPGPWDDSIVEQVTLTEIISDMEKALTDKINNDTSNLSDDLNAKIEARLLSSSAEKPYRDDKTYSVGDVCTKDGKIYCMIQEKQPGDWDGTVVEEITIGKLIRESRAGVLNEVKNTLKGFVSGSAIASNEFDEGENYSTGDTVFYESKLYRFIQNKLAGVFDSSMVEEITLEGLLSELETKIKNDISSMPTDCAKMRALAPEFDETKAYSVGDYISKDGLLYKIIKNKPAGTWDDASVEETKVVDLDIGGSSAPISQNVTKIANISTNGKVHNIDFTNFIDGETIIAPATGWMYAETSRGQTGRNAYVNIYVAKDRVDFEDSSSHYYSALNDRTYDIGNTSALVPVTKGDTVEIYFNQPLTALRIFEVEPIEPKYLTDRTELASLMWSDAVANKIIEVDDLDQYDQVEFELSNNIDGTITEGVSRYVFNNANSNAFIFDYNLSVIKLEIIRWVFDKIPEGLNIRSRTGYSGDFNGVNIKIYGVKTINVDDLVNPIVTDEKKLLYSGNVTGNGDITVGDMSIYNRINIKAFVENPDGSRRLFEDAELIKESGKHTFISINLNANSVIGFYRATYINSTTVGISDFVALNVSGLKFYTEIYGYNEVLANDLVNNLVIGDTVELYKGTPRKGHNKLNGKIEDYDYYLAELIYNNRQREQLFIKVGDTFNILSLAGGTGYWEVIGTISGYDLNLSTLVIPSSAPGVTIIRVTGIKTVTANSLIDKLVIRDSKELAEIPLSKSGDIKSQKVEGLENYDYFEVFFIDSNKKYSSAVNIVRYGESFMASNQYTANLHRSVLGDISNGSINIVEVNGNLYPSYVKVIGYKTVSADDITSKLTLKSVDTLLEMTEITATGEIPLSKPISEYDRVELSVYAEFSSRIIYKINPMIMEDNIPASFVFQSLNNSNMIRAFLFNVKLHESQMTVMAIAKESPINKVFAKVEGYKFAPQEVNINLGLKAKDVLYYGALSKTINLNAKLSDYDEVIAESIYTNDAGDTGTLCSTIVQTGDRIINYLDAVQGSSHNIRFTATDDGVITLTSVPSGNRKLRFTGYKFIEPYTALVEDKTEIAKIPAAEIVENKTFTIPNPVSYYDEIIAQLVIPAGTYNSANYVVETAHLYPKSSHEQLVVSKSYTYGTNIYRRVDVEFTNDNCKLFAVNIQNSHEDCDLILYGVKHVTTEDVKKDLINNLTLKSVAETKKIRTLLYDDALLFGGQMGELPVNDKTFDYLTVEIWGSQSNNSVVTKLGSATCIDDDQNCIITFTNESAMLFVDVQFINGRFAIDSTGQSIESPTIKIYGYRYETTVSFTN